MVEGNIYQRLQAIREGLRESDVRKSGINGAFHFYELADFMPKGNELLKEQGMISMVSFDKELATLTFLVLDSPENRIVFTSPMSTANDRKLHAVQNLGWAQTYIMRRLYIVAYELLEQDPLDGATIEVGKGDVKDRLAAPEGGQGGES